MCDHTEVSVLYDNEKIYEICQRDLKIKAPSHHNMNRLISKNISSVTASFRFDPLKGELDNLDEFRDTLVPFPRLHFVIPSMAPIIPKCDRFDAVYASIDNSPLIQQLNVPPIVNEEIAEYATPRIDNSLKHMIDTCFDPICAKNFFLKIDDFDTEKDKYFAINAIYRGDVKEKEANESVQWVRTNKKVNFLPWVPEKFTLRVHDNNYAILEDDDISSSERSVAMLLNNDVFARYLSERISKKFDLMYSQRAYVHWYVVEGMEEDELKDAREDVKFLQYDYLDVLSDYETDEDDDDSD